MKVVSHSCDGCGSVVSGKDRLPCGDDLDLCSGCADQARSKILSAAQLSRRGTLAIHQSEAMVHALFLDGFKRKQRQEERDGSEKAR